ncbi:MAG: glycosyltransferase family 4 protein [Thermovenabulum sp.]|uniref:glycosyltransferase family 4 protein n=1 Tax=Thermovenabulum sp. TaxID=3100335 RepID=UPI003C7E77DD
MRILFINVLYAPFIGGGAEIILKNLVEGTHDMGHEVKVLSFWDKDDKEEIIDGITVYRAKIPNVYLPYGKIRQPFLRRRLWHILDIYNPISKKIVLKQIRDFKPDIISIHNTQGWSCSIWDAVSEYNVPAIQVLHDLYLLCPTNMFKNNVICKKQCLTCKLMRLPCKLKSSNIKAVVGVSNFILNKLLSYGYFRDVPIKKVIYNSRKLSSVIVERKTDPRYVNFGFIGTLAPNKGIEVLLRAYHKIKKPNYKLFVAGAGKQDYEEYLKSKYKDVSIIFMGRVEPRDFFEKVDVTIVPSIWYENLPGVVYESFTFGIPVIGSDIGGIPEMVTEGVNGMLFDPYKKGDLEEKLLKFESEISDWKNKSEIIKQSAQKFLDYEGWLNQWEELYKLVSLGEIK